ncbi:MAG: helix-turn-helix domain-containing protein [Firmicutes bacterium]|nr:helix-turn-helix domain-containing protein [Bacillota bacterium]
MKIAEKITNIRKNSGLTQKDFADKLFVTRQAVTRWESGETTPTIETLKAMIDLFNVDANVLFDSSCVCQSCGRQFESVEDLGTNLDKSISMDYCNPCITDGELYPANSFDEWVDLCLQYFDNPTAETKEQYRQQLLALKRWSKG